MEQRAAPEIELPEPANAAILKAPREGGGLSSLIIANGTLRSAVVKLVDAQGDLRYAVFVRRGEEASLPAVQAGAYTLWYCFGRNWDPEQRRFTCERRAGKAERSLEFTEQPDEAGITYVKQSVTLHPVPGGDLRMTERSPEEFDRLR
jgi:hypothetical protein